MTTIEFSLIPDSQNDYDVIRDLLNEFQAKTHIEVKVRRMSWGMAWPELMSVAAQAHGPDISHIGSTWVSSLMTMNALRPIPSDFINRVGGEQAFSHATWLGAVTEGDRQVWAIPWSTYAYAVAFRHDLFAQTGLDERTAFATPAAFEESVAQIIAAGGAEMPWLMPVVPPPFNDLLHIAASWVWSSGGDFMDNRGKKVTFDSPAALAGFSAYMRCLRRVPNTGYLGADTCMEHLMQGRAAAVVTDIRSVLQVIQNDPANAARIGVASIMSIPWCGGGSLVVWRHTQGYPERLQASLKLAEFLISREVMLTLGQRSNMIPAQNETVEALFPAEHPLRNAIRQLGESGRPYRSIPLWHRLEYQLGMELGSIATECFENQQADVTALVRENIGRLAERLNLTFGE
jgi:ABC-type glycerol-3-phosphate transport system substrate-binding protein